MARKGSLTHESLAALGAEKLARLVLDEAERNVAFKRLVRAALAGAQGPDAITSVVDRRLAALEKARGFVSWERRKDFAADLNATLAAITDELGPVDPAAGIERALRFLSTADRVFERVDDSSGSIQDIYHSAAEIIPSLAARLSEDAKAAVADRLVPLLLADGYGLIEQVLIGTIPLFSSAVLTRLDNALAASQSHSAARIDIRNWEQQARRDRVIRVRQAVADQRGDVDAFIGLEHERGTHHQDSVGVARRLLRAGRAAEALDWVRRPARPGLRVMTWQDIGDETGGYDASDTGRIRLEIQILEALGEKAAAQELRWQTFQARLDGGFLREYLAHLPDFAEFEVLDRAFSYVSNHTQHYAALAFFVGWPRFDLAAQLVLRHRNTWEGRHYGVLGQAAEALEEAHPEAAIVLYRVLIKDILDRARSPAYSHAARYLARPEALDERVEAGDGEMNYSSYLADLKKTHGRKSAFWAQVKGPSRKSP